VSSAAAVACVLSGLAAIDVPAATIGNATTITEQEILAQMKTFKFSSPAAMSMQAGGRIQSEWHDLCGAVENKS